jgi:hypothetical protein
LKLSAKLGAMPRSLLSVIIIFVSLMQAGCTMWPEKKDPGWGNATGVEQMERLYWKDRQAKNWKEIEARTASNYTHTSADGVQNKQQTMELLRARTLLEHSLGEFEVISHGDTAVVTYVALLRYQDGIGKTVGPVRYRETSVWQQHKGGWALIANAETEIHN